MASSRDGEDNTAEMTSRDKQVLNQIFNPGLPYGDEVETEDDTSFLNESNSEKVQQAKELEIQGVRAAESGNVDGALGFFQQAVDIAPEWPSAYNNRAQALRLKGDIPGARSDLDKAIELSQGRGTAACQAYTQRGLIKKKEGDDDGAKEDLEKAAALGGAFAKQVLVALNPYAALCNQMLSGVLDKLRAGEGQV
ncbi:tetratricopeptide repeat protein 36-like [Plakobranchus ocellatus]|uniref:Tetratricopeptide repeat protein 36-like n=1 Tax=Plakobranchus ocellatus TaxID=259542 RepID=A0AAV4ALJ6_9GAST|nr:tetratricopeptide repeat protein 36-like [Plakobranchus ocellatus]